jgi:hypothetical protein
MNHGVDGRGLERIAADEKRMEGEDFTKALRFDVARGHLPYRAVGAESDQIRGHAQHVGKGGEGVIGQFDEGFLKNGMGFTDKAAIALEVVWEVLADLFFHLRLIAGVFEGLAVVPSDPIERFAGHDFDVIGGFFSCQPEKFIEEERSGEDGGTGVVGESLVTKNGSAATGLFEGLEESDVVATGLKSNGGGETSKA